ncbi:GPR endopeptidase, partial [Escherichia coli]|nr:GPR endopeptidase [Escherichia coli]
MTLDLRKYAVRTDLAIESREMVQHAEPNTGIPGLQEDVEEKDGITITRIDVLNEAASQKIGRVKGHYVTLEVPSLRNGDTELQERVAAAFTREMEDFLTKAGINKTSKVLVV